MYDTFIGILVLIFVFILPLVNKIRDDLGKREKAKGRSVQKAPPRQTPPRHPLRREIEREAEREARRQQRRLEQLKRRQTPTPPLPPEEESYIFDDTNAPVEGSLVVPLPIDERHPSRMTSSIGSVSRMKPLSTDSAVSMRDYHSTLRPSDYILRRKMDERERLTPLKSSAAEGPSLGQALFYDSDDPQRTLREAILRAEILHRRFPHLSGRR